jgi:phosphonoacetaldehyde hydrolase
MIRALILDWAGTTVDYGSNAPAAVMRDLFMEFGAGISMAEAREAMGYPKRDHIAATTRIPRLRDLALDVEAIYQAFIPRQLDAILQYSDVIEGVPAAVDQFRSRGYKIGSTTGYTRPMLDLLAEHAARQGYRPDAHFTPDETGGEGRPAPWMAFANLRALGVYPPSHCVKIGDTPSDIEEGRNAGMWTIGLTDSGNEAGRSDRLIATGAHFTAPSLAECWGALDEIERRLAAGEHPH